jgi:hypothetical protein
MDQPGNMLLWGNVLENPPSRGYKYGGPQEYFLNGIKKVFNIL